MIEVSMIKTGDKEEIISNIRVFAEDSLISLTDADHDGDWDRCRYEPNFDNSTNCHVTINGQSVLDTSQEIEIKKSEPVSSSRR
jgi:hypothetical protein